MAVELLKSFIIGLTTIKGVEMKAYEVVFKTTKIKSIKHYIEHSEYLKKDSAVIYSEPSEEDKLEVVNLQIDRLNKSKGKRGRPPEISKGFIFSINKEVEHIILEMTKEAQNELIFGFMNTMLRDIKNIHPTADLDFLKKNAQIVLHTDTDNFHFHIQLPNFTKSILPNNNDLIAINYGKRTISANARRNMLNSFNKLLNRQEHYTKEDFAGEMNYAKKKYADNKKSGYSKKNEELKEKLKSRSSEISKLKKEKDLYFKERNRLIENVGPVLKKLINTFEKQLENGNTDRAAKTLATIKKKSDTVK